MPVTIKEMTLADYKPLVEFAKAFSLANPQALIAQIKATLATLPPGLLSAEQRAQIESGVTILEANPSLLKLGWAEFEAALAKYPPQTKLVDIPEFGLSTIGDYHGTTGKVGAVDQITYAVPYTQVTVKIEAGKVVVTGPNFTDTLVDVERIKLADHTLAVDINGVAGQAYRLYEAAFNRAPDLKGLGHNVALMDAALTLRDMANAFVNSAEFQKMFGAALSNEGFLNALYQNVLGRAADSAGLAGWLDAMATKGYSRADVLIGFSESAENQAAVLNAIKNGILMDYGVVG